MGHYCFVFISVLLSMLSASISDVQVQSNLIYRGLDSPQKGDGREISEDGRKQVLENKNISTVRFMVGLNTTFEDTKGRYGLGSCAATIITPPFKPGVAYNKTDSIRVGRCDQGPIRFTISNAGKGRMTLDLVYYSSVILDASPPSCSISWNGTYLNPPPVDLHQNKQYYLPSLLPGCSTADSREGYHMTHYWFYIFDWDYVQQ